MVGYDYNQVCQCPGFPECFFPRTYLGESCSCNFGSNNRQGRHGNAKQWLAEQETPENRCTYVSQVVVALVSVEYEVVVSLLKLSARPIGSLTRKTAYYMNAEIIVISVT